MTKIRDRMTARLQTRIQPLRAHDIPDVGGDDHRHQHQHGEYVHQQVEVGIVAQKRQGEPVLQTFADYLQRA